MCQIIKLPAIQFTSTVDPKKSRFPDSTHWKQKKESNPNIWSQLHTLEMILLAQTQQN